ncbi:MAG: response regulator, partial [Candidatus Limnocylindrales bacterium]
MPDIHPPSTGRLLLVEDDLSIRELTALGLRSAGYTVATAASGDDALERFRAEPPDAVVLDIMLPGIDGLTVCRAIR